MKMKPATLIRSLSIFCIYSILLLAPGTGRAMNIAGIDIPDSISISPETSLRLNGAGVRKKLFYNIYIAALYLEQTSSDSNRILQAGGAKRIALHFLYDEVSAQKLIEGWSDGFKNNLSSAQLDQLRERLQVSYGFFQTMHAGDVIYIDYLPGTGTRLSINKQVRGIIPGNDFYQAALKVWIGDHPAQQELKQGMLGI